METLFKKYIMRQDTCPLTDTRMLEIVETRGEGKEEVIFSVCSGEDPGRDTLKNFEDCFKVIDLMQLTYSLGVNNLNLTFEKEDE